MNKGHQIGLILRIVLKEGCNCEYKDNELRGLLRRSVFPSLIKKQERPFTQNYLKSRATACTLHHLVFIVNDLEFHWNKIYM